MNRNSSLAACAALALLTLGTSSQSVHAQLLGNGFDGILYDVSTSTGAATNPRNTGLTNLVGIEYAPNGTLYGLNAFVSSSAPNSLYTINPTTGASTLVGSTGLSSIFEGGLAFDAGGTLYGIQDVPIGPRNLFTLNLTTGAATTLGGIGSSGDISAIAFDASDNLLALDTSADLLLSVDKTNGNITGSVPLSVNLGAVAGFELDPSTGTFYVADGNSGTNTLYSLNITNGNLTRIGPTNVADGLAGLTILGGVAPAVPEPGTVALLIGMGVTGVALRRRRK